MKNGQEQNSRWPQRRSVQFPTHKEGEEGFRPGSRKTKADYRAQIQPASPPAQLSIQREIDAAVTAGVRATQCVALAKDVNHQFDFS